LIKGLETSDPDPDLKEKLMLFGQFVGNWKFDCTWLLPNNIKVEGEGEVSFGWILQGTAIQDVWIAKANNFSVKSPQNPPRIFGTTLRLYDQKINAWQCIYFAPKSDAVLSFIAQKKGKEIVLESKTLLENPEKWIYSEITPSSFQWRSEHTQNNGKTWSVKQKVSAIKEI
jgi:hypothetical protein